MSETDSKLSALRRDRHSEPPAIFAAMRPISRDSIAGRRVLRVRPGDPLVLAVLVPRRRRTARTPARLESTVDASIAPGDDFFAYANGGWLKATAIPAGKERWGARDELEEDDAPPHRGAARRRRAPRRPAPRRARSRTSAPPTRTRPPSRPRGLASLKPLLDRVEKVSDKTELTRLLGRGMRADVDPMGFGIYQSAGVLGLSVEQSIHGEKTNTAFLVQGGLGLPDREDYLSADAAKAGASSAVSRLHPARCSRSPAWTVRTNAASAVLALETAIAQSQAHARGVGKRPQRRQRVDALRLRAAGPRDRLDRLLRRGGAGRAGRARRLAAVRRDRAGGAGRVAAARGLEGLPALPCHPRFRGRAAARLRRAGAGAARRRRARAAALPRRARARRHAIGPEERAGEDVRRALLPRRAEGARGANLRQRPRGAHEAGRGRDVDVAGHQSERACRSCRRCTSGSGIPIDGRTIPR